MKYEGLVLDLFMAWGHGFSGASLSGLRWKIWDPSIVIGKVPWKRVPWKVIFCRITCDAMDYILEKMCHLNHLNG